MGAAGARGDARVTLRRRRHRAHLHGRGHRKVQPHGRGQEHGPRVHRRRQPAVPAVAGAGPGDERDHGPVRGLARLLGARLSAQRGQEAHGQRQQGARHRLHDDATH